MNWTILPAAFVCKAADVALWAVAGGGNEFCYHMAKGNFHLLHWFFWDYFVTGNY